jgi:hypothetical protein
MYVSTLANFKESARLLKEDKVVSEDNPQKKNKYAMIEIMNVYAYSLLVNTFGDIPYSQALDVNNPQPVYDDAKTVTLDLFKRLDAAIAQITPDAGGFGSADLVYGGDAAKWLKFGNSLKLKLAMLLSDADNADAKTFASAAIASGNLILDNADNATLAYLASPPNNNPLSSNVPPISSRQDYVAANTIIDYMNSTSDARRASYFTTVDGAYVGGKYGFTSPYGNNSHLSTNVTATSTPNVMLDASEVHFLLAEAIERGFTTGTAADEYNAAIRASFDYWGAGSADDYLAQDKVNYTNAASGATWQEKIGVQKWVSLFNRNYDGWTSWRQLNFPALVKPDAPTVPDIPTRLIYPIIENSLNKGNTEAAAAKIGGDSPNTKLWWDVN